MQQLNQLQPGRYYDMNVDMSRTTLKDVERFVNDQLARAASYEDKKSELKSI